ncbi:MAG: TetR/AcrR family transcriptional regulator [Intestinibacter sp.]|uniref:TetR/AcrR family transcriptional regulator n=1 Tax=Intestinibacter sp. TaxID=1965304 RepID=UPI003F18AAA5
MSRNKYPEETRQLILEVSARLFLTKGYEKTSLQDIINELGGLTKGAIYHHFKSKEDILISVLENMTMGNQSHMLDIVNDKGLTGKQKLEKMFSNSIKNPLQEEVFSVTPNLLDNPTFLSYYIKMITREVVPEYIVPVVKKGVEDGSIQAEYPEELADALLFMCDVWMNPLIFEMSDEALLRRAVTLNTFVKPFGIELFDEDMIRALQKYRKISADKDDK